VEILNFQNKKYIIKMTTPDTGFSANELGWFKWYKQADTVLKKDGLLYFADEIVDIEFEEISENS
jgi:hypothetical protein